MNAEKRSFDFGSEKPRKIEIYRKSIDEDAEAETISKHITTKIPTKKSIQERLLFLKVGLSICVLVVILSILTFTFFSDPFSNVKIEDQQPQTEPQPTTNQPTTISNTLFHNSDGSLNWVTIGIIAFGGMVIFRHIFS